jgi:hypothetical protein
MFVNYKVLMNNYRNERRNKVHPEFSIFEEILESKNYNTNNFNTYSLTDKIRCEFETYLVRICSEEKDGKLPNNYERWEKVQKEFEEIVNKHQKVQYKKDEELKSQEDIQRTLTKVLMEVEGLHYKMDCKRTVVNDSPDYLLWHILSISISVITLLILILFAFK